MYGCREVGDRCKNNYFVLTLVRENHILVREKSGNFKADLLCKPYDRIIKSKMHG